MAGLPKGGIAEHQSISAELRVIIEPAFQELRERRDLAELVVADLKGPGLTIDFSFTGVMHASSLWVSRVSALGSQFLSFGSPSRVDVATLRASHRWPFIFTWGKPNDRGS